jgi:hypothetical protein
MRVKRLMSGAIVLIITLSGCAPKRMEAVWPQPRPLGRDIPAYRAPSEPLRPSRTIVKEPEGSLTAPFTWLERGHQQV